MSEFVSLPECLRNKAREFPDQVALQVLRNNNEGGEYDRITYAQLVKRCLAVGQTLAEAGIGPGDRVALFADNSPEWVIGYLGAHFTGAALIPVDAQYGADELANLVRFATPKGIITDRAHAQTAADALKQTGRSLPTWRIDDDDPEALVHAPAAREFSPHSHQPDDVMSIIFTSGTTGQPKGVQLTCLNILSNAEAARERLDLDQSVNLLLILPLHHAFAATCGLFTMLIAGATVTFSLSLKGPDLMRTMQDTGVTLFPGVPQLFALFDRGIFGKVAASGWLTRLMFKLLYGASTAILRWTGWRAGRWLLRKVHKNFGLKMKYFVSGGAKLDPEVGQRLSNLGFVIVEGYGMTETSPIIAAASPRRPRIGTVGPPVRGVEVRIDQPDAEGVGEICVRGPLVMKGYYKNEAATREIIRDGWLHTGDLGFMDDEGCITITGRAKDVIVLPSGKNIYPDEVERMYENTDMVREICILPVEDAAGQTQGLRAVVVPDEGQLAAKAVSNVRGRIEHELNLTGARLPSYMRVTDLVILRQDLPRTRLHKLKRVEVAALVEDQKRGGAVVEAPVDPDLLALLEHPDAARFLQTLERVLGKPGPFSPAQSLAIDLGVDSLTLVQILAVLESDFGVKISDAELTDVRTVGDVLRRIVDAADGEPVDRTGQVAVPVPVSWARRLAEPTTPPLEAMFTLDGRSSLGEWLFDGASCMARLLTRLAWNVKTYGRHKIPTGRVLLCPNHLSFLDAPLMFVSLPSALVTRTLFVAYGPYFMSPPLSWVRRWGRVILTGNTQTVVESLQLSHQGLQRELAVCIFPEGARSSTGRLMPARPGAGILACENQAPIVPILIEGTDKTLAPHNPGLHFPSVRVTIGDPLYPPRDGPFNQESYQAMVDRWHDAVARMQDEAAAHDAAFATAESVDMG